MDLHEYSKKALRTDYATYDDFHCGDVTPRLDYAALGLVTELAKVLDLIKKTKKNIQPLDHEKVTEELGDLLWYMNLALNELGLTFEDVMNNSIEKINRKYPPNHPDNATLIRGG